MSAIKPISSFRLASLLRLENNPSTAITLFLNPNPTTNPKPFKYSLLCYDIIITKLGTSKMYTELDQVLLQLKSDTQIIPTETLFCNIIKYYTRGKLLNRALHVFDEMPQYRCRRTTKSSNTLLSELIKFGSFDKAKETLLSIDKPDACTYNILMKTGSFEDSLKLFDEMVKKKVKPSDVTFGILIHGLCKNLKVKEALKMKIDMLKVYGVFPTVYIYASLIKALCSIGELSLAFKLKDEALVVDSGVYSTLISSLIKVKRSNEVSTVLDEMRERGCKPDTVTYNVLIHGYCVENDIESAYGVLDEMVGKGVKPDVIGFNMILGALFRIGNWEKGTYFFEDMPRRGCVPDVLSYRIVFDGLCDGLQFEEAAVVLEEMVFKGYKPRKDRLERFLESLCENGKLEILSRVVSSLCRGDVDVEDVWSVMIAKVCKEANKSDSVDLLLKEEEQC